MRPADPIPSEPIRPGRAFRSRLRRRAGWIVLQWLVLSAALICWVYIERPPLYRATAFLHVEPGSDAAVSGVDGRETAARLLSSDDMLSLALDNRTPSPRTIFAKSADPEGEIRKGLSVRVVPRTAIIEVSFEGRSARDSAIVASAVADAYLEVTQALFDKADYVEKVTAQKRADQAEEEAEGLRRRLAELVGITAADGTIGSPHSPELTREQRDRYLAALDANLLARIKAEARLKAIKDRWVPDKAKGMGVEEVDLLEIEVESSLEVERGLRALLDRSSQEAAKVAFKADALRAKLADAESQSAESRRRADDLRYRSRGAPTRLVARAKTPLQPSRNDRWLLIGAIPVVVLAGLVSISLISEFLAGRTRSSVSERRSGEGTP